ncbi:MAG TPA: hypothetical protein VLL54_12655 [Pyrinomonadaceae bacterium]|nr:hypothetical protein [Pyrinomonadaceae bacterium]
MVETEVESILREIRERVVAQQRAVAPAPSSARSGNGTAAPNESPARNEALAQKLALINSHLTTTGRAWDRLPPLMSNRSGVSARLELWLKRQLKRVTHWFTWEQVNFNAAVHHSLRDLVTVLSAYEDELAQLRSQLAATEARRSELEQSHSALILQLTEQANALRAEAASSAGAASATKNQTDYRFAVLEGELRERTAALQEELRVCFKQLSLETSEQEVLEDRARRKTEALLEELRRRVETLEK